MNKCVFLGTVIAILVISTHGQASAQDIFKWIDENGVVHYGESVPEGVESYERVSLAPPPATPAPAEPKAADGSELSAPETAPAAPSSSAPVAAPRPASAMSLEELNQLCEDVREREIAPLRAAAIEECKVKNRRGDPGYCERFYANTGDAVRLSSGNVRPRMFNDLPECVLAEQEWRIRSRR